MAKNQRKFMLSDVACERLDELAEHRGKPLSEIVEHLIHEAYETPESYMLKQAAFQSFAAMAMSFTVARHVLPPEQFQKLHTEARQLATMLYGEPPRRSWDLRPGTDADARIDALFRAWGG